jgi:hypothetical protein
MQLLMLMKALIYSCDVKIFKQIKISVLNIVNSLIALNPIQKLINDVAYWQGPFFCASLSPQCFDPMPHLHLAIAIWIRALHLHLIRVSLSQFAFKLCTCTFSSISLCCNIVFVSLHLSFLWFKLLSLSLHSFLYMSSLCMHLSHCQHHKFCNNNGQLSTKQQVTQ